MEEGVSRSCQQCCDLINMFPGGSILFSFKFSVLQFVLKPRPKACDFLPVVPPLPVER